MSIGGKRRWLSVTLLRVVVGAGPSYSQRHIEMGANVLADRLHRTEGEVRRDH